MKKKLNRAIALSLSLAMLTSMCTVGASAAPPGGGGGSAVNTSIAGLMSLKSYVAEVDPEATSASFDYYGTFQAGSIGDDASYVLGGVPATLAVYADRAMTQPMEGVSAVLGDGKLTISGLAADSGNTVCYVSTGEDAYPTVVYIVKEQATADYAQQLNDGTTINLSQYAPKNNSSSVYIGGNQGLMSVDNYTDLTDASEADKAIAAWWLAAGITNGGVDLDTFGDTFYNFELAVTLYRMFQIVIDVDTTINADATIEEKFKDPADCSGVMFANDQYSDAVSATIYAGVWDGIYTQVNSNGKRENIPGVETLGCANQVDETTLMVALYNTITSPYSQLNENGISARTALLAFNATTNAEKVAAVKAVLEVDIVGTTQKLAVLEALMAADACVTQKTSPDGSFQEAVNSDPSSNIKAIISDVMTNNTIDQDTVIHNETSLISDESTALFATNGKITIVDSLIKSTGDNTPAAEPLGLVFPDPGQMGPTTSGIGYNMTFANAYYRAGFGAQLAAWGHDTQVELTTTTGELMMEAGAGSASMAGGLYNGFGASIYAHNGVVYSNGQHLSNTVYNGTLHYKDSAALNPAGRQFSSDFWGGYIVFENSVAYGGFVTDEPTTVINKNSVLAGNGSIHGYASMYYENSVIENANYTFQNNTSLITDVGSLTLVNSVLQGSSIGTIQRSDKAVITLVDSDLELTTDTILNITDTNGKPISMDDEIFHEMFAAQGAVYIYGDVTVSTPGLATFGYTSEDGDEQITLYVNNIYGALDTSNINVVYGEAYGDLYVNADGTVLTESTAVDSLVLGGENAAITAPDGYTLTMTVDGVQTATAEGDYAGKVVLTVAKQVAGIYDSRTAWGGMTSAFENYRTGLFVENGALSEAQSVTAAIISGTYDDKVASDLSIVSNDNSFNGVIIHNSDYIINDMVMTANGSGTSDFYGDGAAVAVTGNSEVDVNGLIFFGSGAQRHGVFVGGSESDGNGSFKTAVANVNDSYIRAAAEYTGNSGCPWMLGISPMGTVRATMLDGYATGNYNNSILLSDGWGILSTDDVGQPTSWALFTSAVNAKDCVIDVTKDTFEALSAYGTYAIGACKNTFEGCVIGDANNSDLYNSIVAQLDSAYANDYGYDTVKYGLTYACVIANEYASVEYDDCDITTKYGVMYHKTNNVSYVTSDSVFGYEDGALNNSAATAKAVGATVVKDSTVNTYGAAFVVKACTPVIQVENSVFNSETGIIVQLMTCDDPGMGVSEFTENLAADAITPDDGSTTAGAYNKYAINTKDMTLYGTEIKNMINDVQVSFTDCSALKGDIYNAIGAATNGEGMTWWGQNLVVYMDNSNITGVISSSTAAHNEYGSYQTTDAQGDTVLCDAEGNIYQTETTIVQTPAFGPFPASESTVYSAVLDANGNPILTGEKNAPTVGIIDSANATMLGDVSNTASPAVNNGVLLSLEGSTWNVTGTSYLTGLAMDEGSSLLAPAGYRVQMTVDGKLTTLDAGVYSGDIVISLVKGFSDDTSTGNWVWASKYIYAAVDQGIIGGYPDGTYRVDATLTRAEAAKLIACAAGLEIRDGASATKLSDVSGHWAEKYIAACVKAGIIDGYEDGTFKPNQEVRRGELAKMVSIAANMKDGLTEVNFTDITYHWARLYINNLASNDIVGGYGGGIFGPDDFVSRGQAAKIITGAFELM